MYIMKQIGTHHGNKVIVRKLSTGHLLVSLNDARIKNKDQKSSIVPQSKDLSVDDIDMKLALELLEYPKSIGRTSRGSNIQIDVCKIGYFFIWNNTTVNIPNAIPKEEWLDYAEKWTENPKWNNFCKKRRDRVQSKRDRSTHQRVKSFAYQKLLESIVENPSLLDDMSKATFLDKSELMDILSKKQH
jgi:hypothetical protein